ncbi:unnamed protein product [Cuscuta epithymum]|uniref:F-box domain-containing protein n=1 Tax=Cuscuta epithymum TaxID=186058 RepID=A0AAV0FY57_9ASTE|nr:unnamed protein product [Cuscuta epithymum]CAH9140614.1 unnamed protein product [Cuscuta epithymum]
MPGRQPHPATPVSAVFAAPKRSKKRGSYNCGRCGAPKKGHVCHFTPAPTVNTSTPAISDCTSSDSHSPLVAGDPLPRQPPSRLPRALSFDEFDLGDFPGPEDEDVPEYPDLDGSGSLPFECLWEVLKRLPPPALLLTASVCKGWRDTAKLLWRAAEELRLRVPSKAEVGHVRSLLQKCPDLVRLSLTMQSDVDAMMLACIAFSCPKLESLEIFISKTSVNRITGDELSHFLSDRKCLSNLKMEGCSNLGGFVLCSSKLSSLWLSELRCLSKMVFKCPSLKEISLDFSQENDNTDITTMVDCLGRGCPRLQNIHISSVRLSHSSVLALAGANLRWLRMLSLVLGSEITDASVAAIAFSYPRLELLDLSGSSITDAGIGMICNVFAETLSNFLIAICPNITSSGIQFAAAELPQLELLDCGMTICDQKLDDEENSDYDMQKLPTSEPHIVYQKLIIKHSRLKKLSLWGCSGLDALYLNCPELVDLNINCCRNLQPERLLLQCPNLGTVHASGCQGSLVECIQTQVLSSNFADVETHQFPLKRMPDGSKRIQAVPYLFNPQPFDEKTKKRKLSVRRRNCAVLVNYDY